MKFRNRFLVARLAGLVLFASLAACGGGEGDSTCRPAPGVICTFAGTGAAGLNADGQPATKTELYLPQDLTFGPDGLAYILDWNNHRVRVIDALGRVQTLIGSGYLGDAQDGPATQINLNHPSHVSFAPNGDLILSAWHNSKVLRYSFATKNVMGICGNGMRSWNGDGMPGPATAFNLPVATAVAPDGRIFVSDQANQRIRVLGLDGTVSTVVGSGMVGYSGDGGPALAATVNLPVSQTAAPAGRMAMDLAGVIYLADTGNHVIRRIGADGIVSTIAGTGLPGKGADGPARMAALDTPSDVDFDAKGNVFIADTFNSCIRRVDAAGNLTTVAGVCGQAGKTGDGGPATKALLDRPYGVALDKVGNLYIADTHNHVLRVVYATP